MGLLAGAASVIERPWAAMFRVAASAGTAAVTQAELTPEMDGAGRAPFSDRPAPADVVH